MTVIEKKNDIAISFLHRDEPLALELHLRLSENFSVFVYSKKQEELAGTDGLESFRQAFRDDSRLVVVLYRDGWGKTPWTRVEETAIKDRFLEEGWDWLLFVALDDSSTPPAWLPKSEIRLNFPEYGIEQLLGAIKLRAQKLGSAISTERALDKAKRLQEASTMRAERERMLTEQGMKAFREEYEKLYEVLSMKLGELCKSVPEIAINYGSGDSEFVLGTNQVSVNLNPNMAYSTSDRRIEIQEWLGRLILPLERSKKLYIRNPRAIGVTELFYFDWQSSWGWCWRFGQSVDRFMAVDELAEHVIKLLLDLQAKFERGEIRWREGEW